MRITWKPGQMLPTFDYTITVLNKLAARDSATKLDVWKATILHNCSWSGRAERSVSGNTVSVGNVFVVRVPKSTDYHPYNEHCKQPQAGGVHHQAVPGQHRNGGGAGALPH